MKNDIHPTYYADCKASCACGNTFITGSTKKEIRVEVCAACHPFFTGEQKFVDTEGRVDKFIRKRKEAEEKSTALKERKAAKKKRREETHPVSEKSLKDLLEEEKKELSKKKSTPTDSKAKAAPSTSPPSPVETDDQKQ